MTSAPRIALVTGANRGIGLEIARQLARRGDRVILGSRDAAKGKAAAEKLGAEGLAVETVALDVADLQSVERAVAEILARHGRVDVLVNNAGVFLDKGPKGMFTAFDSTVATLQESMATNVYGPYRLLQLLVPGMVERGYGRVVNVSSGLGQLSEMKGRIPAYRMSKAALNVLTRVFAGETGKGGADVLVNSICPGWVRSDMGGPDAARSLEQGAASAVWAATLPAGGPTGGFFRDGESLDW